MMEISIAAIGLAVGEEMGGGALMVLAGLIPIIGIIAAALLVIAAVRREPEKNKRAAGQSRDHDAEAP